MDIAIKRVFDKIELAEVLYIPQNEIDYYMKFFMSLLSSPSIKMNQVKRKKLK